MIVEVVVVLLDNVITRWNKGLLGCMVVAQDFISESETSG